MRGADTEDKMQRETRGADTPHILANSDLRTMGKKRLRQLKDDLSPLKDELRG